MYNIKVNYISSVKMAGLNPNLKPIIMSCAHSCLSIKETLVDLEKFKLLTFSAPTDEYREFKYNDCQVIFTALNNDEICLVEVTDDEGYYHLEINYNHYK